MTDCAKSKENKVIPLSDDRAEIIESALDSLPLPVLVLNRQERPVFWNRSAEALTGYPSSDIIGRPLPPGLSILTQDPCPESTPPDHRLGAAPVLAQHKNGSDVPVTARILMLRDGLGRRIGKATLFPAGDHGNALPHGNCRDNDASPEEFANLEERLEFAFTEFEKEAAPCSILWISVDQAQELRTTHGARACETMLSSIERTLANGLKPGEEIGRWGDGEFLVLAHEADPHKLDAHARVLAGLARTADFRWWGDRVALTVSIGSAVAECSEPLRQLLLRTQSAMQTSVQEGGNRTTPAAGGALCSQS